MNRAHHFALSSIHQFSSLNSINFPKNYALGRAKEEEEEKLES